MEGMDYEKLYAHKGLKKLWACEKKKEGRDWSAAIKAAHMMKRLGLKEIGIRLNDRVHFISPETEEREPQIRALMSRGMDRKEADEFLEHDERLARFFKENRDEVSFTRFQGALITFGRKEKRAQDASHIGRNA